MTSLVAAAVRGTTRPVGLIGDPVAHSLSPPMQNAAFAATGLDLVYVPLLVRAERLDAALAGLAALGFVGANVTIPHKEAVARRCAGRTAVAEACGSVNTVTVAADGSLDGDSTDGAAVVDAVRALRGEDTVRAASLVLGAGGAALAAAAALATAGSSVTVYARRPEAAAAVAARLAPLGAVRAVDRLPTHLPRVVVNATPLGGASALEESPLPADALARDQTVVDLAYRPDARPTRLVEQAAAVGAGTVDGLEILVRQGALSFEQWTGTPAPLAAMRAALGR